MCLLQGTSIRHKQRAGGEKERQLDGTVNDKGCLFFVFFLHTKARKWKAVASERSNNGLGGDVRRRRHCAHGAKRERVKTGGEEKSKMSLPRR